MDSIRNEIIEELKVVRMNKKHVYDIILRLIDAIEFSAPAPGPTPVPAPTPVPVPVPVPVPAPEPEPKPSAKPAAKRVPKKSTKA